MDYYTNQTYYDVLGVSEDASLYNIERAKDRLKFGNSNDRVPFNMWDKIDEAYNVLSNAEKRREYDKKLQADRVSDVVASNVEELDVSETPGSIEEEQEEIISETPGSIEEEQEEIGSETSGSIEEEQEEIASETAESVEEQEEDKEKTYEEIYDEKYAEYTQSTVFNPEESNKKNSSSEEESKLKKIGKYVGGSLVGFMVAGPLGAVAVPIWMKKHKKKKLQKSKKTKKITEVKTSEMEQIKKYNDALDKEINRLLSRPHNSYRLEICKAKYQKQEELLLALLQLKSSIKPKKGLLKYKFEIISIKNQLKTVRENLKSIEHKIAEYENRENKKSSRLGKLNEDLDKTNQALAQQATEIEVANQSNPEKFQRTSTIRITNISQTRLMRKRDKAAKKTKFRVVKSRDIYDKLLYAKDFVKSLAQIFQSDETIDNFVNEELNAHIR